MYTVVYRILQYNATLYYSSHDSSIDTSVDLLMLATAAAAAAVLAGSTVLHISN